MKTWRDYPILQHGKYSYRGTWDDTLFDKSIAVVGSRRITRYGHDCIEKILPDLIANKITIISGFMYGVDTVAHSCTLKYGGKTVAVLGSGLNYLYPLENDQLYTQIIETGGLVLSVFPTDLIPTLWSFPQRNREVVDLSTLGVLVIEAGIKSGSLITAKLANKAGKNVFAIPGPITSTVSYGTNYLIKNGLAQAILSSQDILPDLCTTQLALNLSDPILQFLQNEALSIDELLFKTKLSLPDLSTKLTKLSFDDKIEEQNGKFFLVPKGNRQDLQ